MIGWSVKFEDVKQTIPCRKIKRAESRKYISLRLHTDLFSKIGFRPDINNRVEFKDNKHIWIENIYINITLIRLKWGTGTKYNNMWENNKEKCNVLSKTEITALVNCQSGFYVKKMYCLLLALWCLGIVLHIQKTILK